MPGNKSSETEEAARWKMKCNCAPRTLIDLNARRCSIHRRFLDTQKFFNTIIVVHEM